MDAVTILMLAASALFAWSMGSHYTGAVMGTAYGAGILQLRTAQWLAATLALVGSIVGSGHVVSTYAHRLVEGATPGQLGAALLTAAVITTLSTYYRLPTSTIQIYTFSLLGMALTEGLTVRPTGFGLLVAAWVAGPLAAAALSYLLGKAGLAATTRGAAYLRAFVIVASLWSSFTLGSNDISNAISAVVAGGILPQRTAAIWGGLFMALGVLTWGQGLLKRIGRDILPLNVPLAATAQVSQAGVISLINLLGYNASVNQTIVGGLAGVGLAVSRNQLNTKVLRNIVLNWVLSPILGMGGAALVSLIVRPWV